MRTWLHAHACTLLAMKSTGVYWKPIFNLLEGDLSILLVHPAHIKQVPGRKTDVKDCQWVAELFAPGPLRGRCIPPARGGRSAPSRGPATSGATPTVRRGTAASRAWKRPSVKWRVSPPM
jgi:hypothetical protein